MFLKFLTFNHLQWDEHNDLSLAAVSVYRDRQYCDC